MRQQTPLQDDFGPDAGTLDERTVSLQARADAVATMTCHRCGEHQLCGHEALLSIVFGCSNAPRCAPCLAREHTEALPDLLVRALQWIVRRDCFLHVWRRAGEREHGAALDRPACLPFGTEVTSAPTATPTTVAPAADARFDAGDLGCGDLVLELRFRLAELPPGGVLHVTAHDPAAPVDLPAWCGLCGHTLRHQQHPQYWIQRKRA